MNKIEQILKSDFIISIATFLEDEKLKDLVNIIKNILNNKEFHKEIFTDKYWEKTFLYMYLSSNLQKNHNNTKEHFVKI